MVVMIKIYLLVIFCTVANVASLHCDRRPYGSTSEPSSPEGRFKLDVVGVEDGYIPDQLYTLQIKETDGESRFTSFMISAEGDIRPDPDNPKRMVAADAGVVRPQNPSTAKLSDRCLNSVEQVINNDKESVDVYWQAPSTGNGCVTLRAMVAEDPETWFEDGPLLTRILCEDTRQPNDVTPQVNECGVCDEAKYEISFTGIWSRNTHPYLFPENDWLLQYSNLVGASHGTDYILWSPGAPASEGLKEVAENANSTKLEEEIRGKIGDGIRTLVKGKGHGHKKMSNPTYSYFRTDKVNHLISIAVGFFPSPDWFLGVARFELCTENDTWVEGRELNLYPWDAGTDSGVSYESSNLATNPQDVVKRVEMSSSDENSPFYQLDMKDLYPFGKLELKLMRIYHRVCEETTEIQESPEGAPSKVPDENEPEEPSRYQNELDGDHGRETPVVVDPETPDDCPLSQWQDVSDCEGPCVDGKIVGYKSKERFHLVNNVAVERYDPDIKPFMRKTVPENCKTNYETFVTEKCEEDCEKEEDLSAQRRIMKPLAPGQDWIFKKRDLTKSDT